MGDDVSRRDYLKGLGVIAAATVFSGTSAAQSTGVTVEDDGPLQSVSYYLGTVDDSPNNISELQPGGGFFEGDDWEKTYYAYIYRRPNGEEWYITQDDSQWSRLDALGGIKTVLTAADLPPAENGVRTLDDSYNGYWWMDFVADPATLDPNGVPLVGFHGSAGGYIHTGGTIGFQTSGTGFYVDNFFGHAPGAQLFDLHADANTRFYATDSAFFDPGGQYGDILNLGVVDGYKVQSFKSVNFENFAQGLTVTGSPDKTFFDTCPFRNISGTGTTLVTGDSNYDVDIMKFIGSYVKDVQADTGVVDLSASGLPKNYFKYINVDHDASFNKDQVFTGFKTNDVGVVVRNSFPLADSTIVGDLTLDAPIEPLIGSGSAPTAVTQGTWTLNLALKTSSPSPGVVQYDAKRDHNVRVEARITVTGSNTEFSAWIAKNGTVIDRSQVNDATAATSKARTITFSVQVPEVTSDTPDQFSLFLENTGGTTDLDVTTANIKLEEV